MNQLPLWFRRFVGISTSEEIRGLPEFQFNELVVPDDTWERKAQSTAYGKYFRTLTLNRGGSGKTFATFATSLPTQGTWRLEYLLPQNLVKRTRRYGTHTSIEHTYTPGGVAQIDVHLDEIVRVESIDSTKVAPGWHAIGTYEVENPEVEVRISNPNKNRTVYADAIRWSHVENDE